ncbi:hypothetical protein VP01_2607g1 [Puccinia sorghi]|uniref:Uncharacterized protein n=1 Tax=Puccinia sorghi TaxID=27349 RepID=A0A0L6V4L7_9BASI|nr:hypothetical protein VP01_2607g1 [Puccinia sorghi]
MACIKQHSTHQEANLIHKLFLIAVRMEHEELDKIMDHIVFHFKSLPTKAEIFFLKCKTLQLMNKMLLSDCELIEEVLQLILRYHYLHPCLTSNPCNEFDLVELLTCQ